MSLAQLIAAQAQLLVDTAMKAFARPAEDHWKSDMDRATKDLCETQRWSVTATKGRMYAELEQTANCNINARLNALRRRKKKTGARYRDAMALNKLDAIAADKQLRAIFEGIVRSWQAQAVPTGEASPE